jgi:hypothetical protein
VRFSTPQAKLTPTCQPPKNNRGLCCGNAFLVSAGNNEIPSIFAAGSIPAKIKHCLRKIEQGRRILSPRRLAFVRVPSESEIVAGIRRNAVSDRIGLELAPLERCYFLLTDLLVLMPISN